MLQSRLCIIRDRGIMMLIELFLFICRIAMYLYIVQPSYNHFILIAVVGLGFYLLMISL